VEFHKSALKVMAVVLLMLAFASGAGLVWDSYVKPLKNEILSRGLGSDFLECVKSFKAKSGDLLKDTQAQEAQTRINMYTTLFLVVQLGILYLFSCLIVRLLSKTKSNSLVERTR
jgi:hypothetical protein